MRTFRSPDAAAVALGYACAAFFVALGVRVGLLPGARDEELYSSPRRQSAPIAATTSSTSRPATQARGPYGEDAHERSIQLWATKHRRGVLAPRRVRRQPASRTR